MRNAILRRHTSNFSASEKGALFEQWLLLQVIYYARIFDKSWRISTFRTDGSDEVDLVIDDGDRLVAVEVKYRHTVRSSMLKGLHIFSELVDRPVTKYLVYIGEHRQSFEGDVLAVPFRDFLETILPDL